METRDERLNLRVFPDTKRNLLKIIELKKNELGIKLSYSQAVEMLIEQEANRLRDNKQLDLFNDQAQKKNTGKCSSGFILLGFQAYIHYIKFMAKTQKNSNARTRNYAFIVYPESAPANWIDILDNEHVEVLISPLHDKDVNPDNELKKAHYHVLILFSSVKTIEQATEIRDKVGGVGWENVASVRGYARYLCHLDNPDKYQYDVSDVIELGGADFKDLTKRASDGNIAVAEMMEFIDKHNVRYYSDFIKYCRLNREDWLDVLINQYSYIMSSYFKAINAKIRDEESGRIVSTEMGYVNKHTGEVFDLSKKTDEEL